MISVGSVVQIYSGPPAFALRASAGKPARLARRSAKAGWQASEPEARLAKVARRRSEGAEAGSQ